MPFGANYEIVGGGGIDLCFVREDDDTPTGQEAKHFGVSGELSGRVIVSQLPAPGSELVAICKRLLPLPI
ncbi:MAG TPA: hypothetical protein VNY05_05215 [Candidatus Acidoferrales bacterium]|jgi:hypothetical protein|nr:hypothetical protein [Candidatus Acidoferrales bacterium]